MRFTRLILIFVFIFLIQIKVNAVTLTYEEVQDSAFKNSFDLKIAAMEINISQSQLKAVKAERYPTLSLQFNTEYNRDLTDGKSTYAYAGNTMITPYTQFRDMLYMTLSYNLFDFGVTGKKIHIAKQEVEQKKISYNIQLRDLKLKILDLYTKAQQFNNEIQTKSEILKLYETMFKNKERMFKAGLNDKLSVMDEAVKIAKTKSDVENSKIELKNILKDLSYYTLQDYETSDLKIKNIDERNEENIVPVSYDNLFLSNVEKQQYDYDFDPYSALEAEYYDIEINKKQTELTILKRQLYPSFRFYTGYSLYGQNPNQYYSAMQDIGQRSFLVGISSTYVFFDGFKNRANREKTAFEIEELKLEKEKRLADLKKEYDKSFQSFEIYTEELNIKRDVLNTVKDKLSAVDRLTANKLADNNELLAVKAELLTQEYELEQNIINISSKIEEMKIITGMDI